MAGRILIVDDDGEMCSLLEIGLKGRGFQTAAVQSADDALLALRDGDFDVVVTDVRMAGMNGLALCERISANRSDVPVIVMTAFGSMDTAIAAIRAGAYDYLVKPLEIDVLELALRRAIQHHELREEVKRLRHEVAARYAKPDLLLGTSAAMTQLQDILRRIATSDSSVLVVGESGTGKELVARTLHDQSERRDGPFVAINCAALPDQLLESELFGHVRGAFTDARADHPGLMVRANTGTLFLDEVADMPLSLQPKLLRALQERVVRPVGSHDEIPFDTRVIAATNRHLEMAIERKEFRSDLFFRLNVINVKIPPLRARKGDILLLAQEFVTRYATRANKAVVGISPVVAEKLLAYDWPGNVRELENAMEHGVALARHEQLTVDDLPESLRTYRAWHGLSGDEPQDLVPMREVEQRYVAFVLKSTGGNKRRAAKILGFDRATLYRKLARYGMDEDDGKPD